MKKIYIVDVSSMFFRAFYAIRPLTSTKGVPVNAVYGFLSMIVKLLKEKRPDHLVFCYDRKEPSFRKDLYTDYKANRSEMPDDLQVQMPYLKQVARLLGITDLEVAGYEADDLIGTVATLAVKNGEQAYIVSGDKDFCQLVGPNVFLYDTMKELTYDAKMVKEKHGVFPEQFIDFLAITGDTSDNIPGVAGIGPKGAQKLIEDFGTLEKIYESIDKVASESIKKKLIDSKVNAFLSKTLVTIVNDVKIDKSIDDFLIKPILKDELRAFLQDLNFKTFEKTLLADENTEKVVHNPASGAEFVVPLVNPNAAAGGEGGSADALEILWPTINHKSWDQAEVQKRISDKEAFSAFVFGSQFGVGFKSDFYSTDMSTVGLNFDGAIWSGFDVKKVWTELGLKGDSFPVSWDLMLGAYVLRAADCSEIETLLKHFFKHEIDLSKIENESEKMARHYQAILLLNDKVKADLEAKDLTFVYEKLEKPIIQILYKMERKGIALDLAFLKSFSEELTRDIATTEKKIIEIAGESFNVASPKQLGVVLFEKMGLEAIKKTKTGYSTDNDVLEKLDHPIAKEVITFRELSKLKSTYVDSLPELADQNHRVHTHFNQALTATGRFSSTNPNIQNIPIKTEIGQRVRKAFVAEKGKKLLSVDYSQIELRVLAHISNDEGLIKAFTQDLDIHAATAAEVFGVAVDKVSKEQRRIAKAVNFGIAYGQGAFGLAETLGIPRKEASHIIERYFTQFSGIKTYIENTIKLAHEQKYVETLFGRRRYIAELDNKNVMVKKFGERAAINAPIQGTASDLVKMAMIELSKGLKVDMLLQVHDELIFEGTPELIEQQIPWIKKTMENVAQLKVPLKVNYAVGNNWDDAH